MAPGTSVPRNSLEKAAGGEADRDGPCIRGCGTELFLAVKYLSSSPERQGRTEMC